MKILCSILIIFLNVIFPQSIEKKFDETNWDLSDATIIKKYGNECLKGTAILKGVEFCNGVIEYDIYVTGERVFPEIMFRVENENFGEKFYLRPHKSGLYNDVLQYTPVYNGVSGWQLYHGKGCTAPFSLKKNSWNQIKLVVEGYSAKVFINNGEKAALEIDKLQRGVSKGSIYFNTSNTERALVANVRISQSNNNHKNIKLNTPPSNIISNWELSRVYNCEKYDIAKLGYPNFYSVFYGQWQKVTSREDGLVDISKYQKRNSKIPELVMARTDIFSNETKEIRLDFGYSDEITIFHNGRKIFYGNSSFRSRDYGFAGIVGYNDCLYLTLEKGINQIYVLLKEKFGGWGFKFKTDIDVLLPKKEEEVLTKIWETDAEFLTPESVVFDKDNQVLYVSSFDLNYMKNRKQGFISKVSLDGKIIEKKWINGLDAPCGLTISNGKLYTVERDCITEISIKDKKVINRIKLPDAVFPNDITADKEGNIYVSDTGPGENQKKSLIYKYANGKASKWYDTEEINRANGLTFFDGKLLLGNSGDGFLKSICTKSKKITNLRQLGGGILDGIKPIKKDGYLVSHWEGKIFLVDNKNVTEIKDLRLEGFNTADFEYLEEQNLLIVPTFSGNKIVAYKINL